MAKEKKPSIYSDRGNIGSAVELDEYGVWVKSEPQVIASGADVPKPEDFDDSMFSDEFSGGDASGIEDIEFPGDSPGDDNFGTDFEDFAVPTVRSIENNIESIQNDFENGGVSTQLLKKIASELSSIRGELHDLKKEFATVRSGDKDSFFPEEDDEKIALTGDEMDDILTTDGSNDKVEVKTMANILSEDEDETIALTGDEMNNILNSADFTEESGAGEYDDETIALTGDEMDNILNSADFTEETGTEESTDNDLSADLNDVNFTETDPSLSGLDFNDIPENTSAAESAFEESTVAEESEVINDVTSEDDLVTDDFDMSALDDTSTEGNGAVEESSVASEEDVTLEDDLAMDDFDMSALDDTSAEESEVINDVTPESDPATDDFDMSALDDTSAEENNIVEESSVASEEDVTSEDDLAMDDFDMSSLDDTSFEEDITSKSDLATDDFNISALGGDASEEEVSEENTFAVEEDGASEESATAEDSDISIDDDIFSLDDSGDLGSEIATDDFDMSALDDDDSEENTSEGSAVSDESETKKEYIDIDIADLGVNLDEEQTAEEESADTSDESADMDSDITKDSDGLEELRNKGATPVTFPPENSSYLEEDDPFDLSEAVIDEPDLSTEGIDEPLSEPSLDMDSLDDFSITTDDETSLDEVSIDESSLDDLDIDIDIPPEESEEDDRDITIDEHIIPEGFEAEIQETPVPLDEDIEEDIIVDEPPEKSVVTQKTAPAKPAEPENVEAIEGIGEIGEIADIDETPPKAPSVSAGITAAAQKGPGFQLPSDLKKELKNILSYMDQLLESLPEEKIEEFAKSEYFDSYKKLFKELGLV